MAMITIPTPSGSRATAPVTSAPLPYTSVRFEGNLIAVTEHNGEPYVGMKAVVAALGMDWGTQYRKIMSDSVLRPSIVMMTIETPAGPRPSVFLPLRYLAGSLFKITPSQVAPALRPRLQAALAGLGHA